MTRSTTVMRYKAMAKKLRKGQGRDKRAPSRLVVTRATFQRGESVSGGDPGHAPFRVGHPDFLSRFVTFL